MENVKRNEEQERIQEVAKLIGSVKFTKTGNIKHTINNQKKVRKVVPLKDKTDIEACKEYLRNKRNKATKSSTKYAAARNLMLFCISLNEGIRVSDIIKLEWNHVFLADGKTFRDSYTISEEKTDKTKTVYINEAFRSAVTEFLSTYPETDTTKGNVFIGKNKTPLGDDTVYKFMKTLQKEVLNDKINIGTHTFRKTFGTEVYKKTNNIAIVQELLNHSDVKTTRKYLGLTDEDMRNAYNSISL